MTLNPITTVTPPVLNSRSSCFSCFSLILCQFETLFEGETWRSHLLCLIDRSELKLNLFCVCASSDKLDTYHVRRPVSRDRRILVMEVEEGKAAHVVY